VAVVNWLSVGGVDRGEVLARLYMAERANGETTWETMTREIVFEVAGPRVVLFATDMIFSPEMALVASKSGDAIFGWMSESVAGAYVARYIDGVEVWSVENESDRHPEVIAKGEPPPSYEIYMKIANTREDTFEVPLQLSAEFGRFRPDMELFPPVGPLRLIEPIYDFDYEYARQIRREKRQAARGEGRGFLWRLFGRK
jgi:hypothetical protein